MTNKDVAKVDVIVDGVSRDEPNKEEDTEETPA
jgi:uncharacterized alkaline shock family protein YloU